MKFKKILVTTLFLFIPLVVFFFTLRALISAESVDEPYSIVILAGQSWAEGTNSFRSTLPAGTGFDKHDHPADTATQFWWAGADGKGPSNFFEFLNLFYNNQGIAGWVQSGGNVPSGPLRMKNLNDTQRGGLFGPELGIARTMYDKGRRKVIVLKVSYGFQSLAQSNSPFIPYDWNVHSTNKSYDRLKTEFNALTTYISNSGEKYTVDGFFWLQGGTDALQTSYANVYQQNLTDLMNSVRTDFRLQPSAHIVATKMSLKSCIENSYPLTIFNYCGFPYAQSVDPLVVAQLDVAHANLASRVTQVRNAIQAVADSDQNQTIKMDVTEVNDEPMSSDYIHNNEIGNLQIGKRMVNMYRLPYRLEGSNDYDGDGIPNSQEDTGRGASCPLAGSANNGNLGDDDSDCDGYPNYLDRINGPGSGLAQ